MTTSIWCSPKTRSTRSATRRSSAAPVPVVAVAILRRAPGDVRTRRSRPTSCAGDRTAVGDGRCDPDGRSRPTRRVSAASMGVDRCTSRGAPCRAWIEVADSISPRSARSGRVGNRVCLIITGYPEPGNGTSHLRTPSGERRRRRSRSCSRSVFAEQSNVHRIIAKFVVHGFIDGFGKFITVTLAYIFQRNHPPIYMTFIAMYLVFVASNACAERRPGGQRPGGVEGRGHRPAQRKRRCVAVRAARRAPGWWQLGGASCTLLADEVGTADLRPWSLRTLRECRVDRYLGLGATPRFVRAITGQLRS